MEVVLNIGKLNMNSHFSIVMSKSTLYEGIA